MRRLTSLIVVTLLTFLLSGCGNDQGKTVIKYCKALEAGDVDKAASYLSKDARQALESLGGKKLLAEAGGKFKERKGIKSIKITKEIVKDKNAAVELVYNFNDGSNFVDNFPLVKEDGKWKISR